MANSFWNNIFEKNGNQQLNFFAVLRQVPIFKDLKKGELREFKKIIHKRYYKKDEIIFFDGEPGVGMYIIETGTIGIYKDFEGEAKEELAVLKSGDFIGEMALLDDSPRSATAVALENTHLLGLFRPDLFGLLERKPRLGNEILLKLAQMIAERLRLTNMELQHAKQNLETEEIIR